MPRCASQGLDVFSKTLWFVRWTIRLVHHSDPVHCFPWDEGQALMKPGGPLLRRKLQDHSAEAKKLKDAVANFPLRKHGPEQPLNESGQNQPQDDAKVHTYDGLKSHRLLGIQAQRADSCKQRKLHAISDSRNCLREVAEQKEDHEEQHVEDEIVRKGRR